MSEQQRPWQDWQALYVQRWERAAAGCPARVEGQGGAWYCQMTTWRCELERCVPQHWDPA